MPDTVYCKVQIKAKICLKELNNMKGEVDKYEEVNKCRSLRVPKRRNS